MNDTFLNNIYNIFNTTYGTQQTEISWNLPATQCQYNGYSTVHILCLQKKENCTYQMNNYRYLLNENISITGYIYNEKLLSRQEIVIFCSTIQRNIQIMYSHTL